MVADNDTWCQKYSKNLRLRIAYVSVLYCDNGYVNNVVDTAAYTA